MPAKPIHPIAAVTHANPYPFYAELLANQPIYYDDTLKMWVASSAETVRAVLSSPLVCVRPPAEPVPNELLNSPAAEIFRHLIRMNDGAGHCPVKRAVTTTFDALSSEQLAAQSEYWAQFLARELWLASRPERLTDFAFHLPVYVLASLLGVPQDRLPEVAAWVGDFVRGIAAGSSAQHIDQCKQAAEKLLRLFHALLVDQQTRSANTLLIALTQNAHDAGCEDNSVIAANAIGFLMQSYEATAGLIGNTLVLLAKNQEVCAQITGNWTLVSPLLCEVLRCDSSVQNTRRFVARDGTIAGCDMKAGDAILVVLAAANYDPTANPKPEVFDLLRETRQIFIFGVGIHACSGETIATSIAEAAIKALLAIDLEFAILRDAFTYRSSANTRIPVWTF